MISSQIPAQSVNGYLQHGPLVIYGRKGPSSLLTIDGRKFRTKCESDGTNEGMTPESFLDDLDLLRRTAWQEQGGFDRISARRVIWPILVSVDPLKPASIRQATSDTARDALLTQQLRDQIGKDVNRSMYLVESGVVRQRMREKLTLVMNRVLDAHPELSYYQGFHDLVTVVLLVCKKLPVVEAVMERLALGPLAPLLAPDLAPVTQLLQLLFPIVALEDASLHSFLIEAGVQPYFALPWVLTWFSHSVANFESVQRIFDVFLAAPDSVAPLMPFFLSVAVILWSKPLLLHSGNVVCEYSAVHSFYAKLFSDISLNLNVPLDDPRRKQEISSARLIDENLESILSSAIALSRRHLNLVSSRSEAQLFLKKCNQIKLSTANPPIRLPMRLPRRARVPLITLQYRFEGVVRQRREQKLKRSRVFLSSFLVLVSSLLVALYIYYV